ncbi:hypothetical protein FK513_32045, partial [Klebsiella pneumoniae]|nr:hypothetical protein [Klebsiella pneumoniae]
PTGYRAIKRCGPAKGQAFALLEGGQLWKLRIPLPDAAHDPLMPENIAQITRYMEKQYDSAPVWWNRLRKQVRLLCEWYLRVRKSS